MRTRRSAPDVIEGACRSSLATESVRSTAGGGDVRTSGSPGSCRGRRRCPCHLPPPGRGPGVGRRFCVRRGAHGPSWSQGGGPGGSRALRGRSGDDEGLALRPRRQPALGRRPAAAAAAAAAAAGPRGRLGLAAAGGRAGPRGPGDLAAPASRPHRRRVAGPGARRRRGAAGRGGRQRQQPPGGAGRGRLRREGPGGRLGGREPGREPQPRRQADDPAGPDRADGGERRGAGVLRRQDRQKVKD
ncbi:membrane protein FAM174A isoform X1 [Canis lupus familiaris]|uniref:membrane protein FAM174A isoform X1 n=1 Tax=Canis lupus familiaris TaxID=9615 RepID=UPI0018F7DA65|nr:membrane protein FAM174A isoform X1 [Canis lupus familiaris]XP_038516663.1 membrane protein FAM174A isoform X1 [Canis lupus familiaris]